MKRRNKKESLNEKRLPEQKVTAQMTIFVLVAPPLLLRTADAICFEGAVKRCN